MRRNGTSDQDEDTSKYFADNRASAEVVISTTFVLVDNQSAVIDICICKSGADWMDMSNLKRKCGL